MTLETRQIKIDDLPALYRLIPRLWIEQGHAPTNEVWIDTSGDFIKKHLGKLVIGAVAIDSNNPHEIVSCGFGVIWQQLPTFWNISGQCGFCQWFYTTPEHRGQKLGDQIMRIVMDWFAERGITRVQLNATHKAMPFYNRFGFELNEGWPQMQWKKPGTDVV
jgi:GNAT superfamily N-acetyltransferase